MPRRPIRNAARRALAGKPRPPRWLKDAVGFEEVIAAVEKARSEKWEVFRERHGDSGRDLVLFLARRAGGLGVTELANRLGLAHAANVSMALRRYELKLSKTRPNTRSPGPPHKC